MGTVCAPSGRVRWDGVAWGQYSEPTVVNLTRWASGLKLALESDAGRSDRRSLLQCLEVADRTLKRESIRVATDRRFFFSVCCPKPTPPHTGRHYTHARPLDRSSAGRSR